jgi:hypothetical protein
MGENGGNSSEERNMTWVVILIAFVALIGGAAIVGELAWPGRAKLFYPWGQPILMAILWSSFFVILCRRLLRKWTFWIALAAGIVAQVWAAKALIVDGVYLMRLATEATVLLGIVVWGVVYVLLTWIGIALEPEESVSGLDGDEL